MFSESTFTVGMRARNSEAMPSFVRRNDVRDARPPRMLRRAWLTAGAAMILGALGIGVGLDRDGSDDAFPSKITDALQGGAPTLGGAQLAVARAETNAPVTVLVPQSSVAIVDGKPMVFVAEPDLRLFVATPVELGETVGAEQRIASGLFAGQRVVTEGLAELERRLR